MFKKLLTLLSAFIILTFGTAFAGVEINDQRGLVGSWDLSQESYNITTKRLTDSSGPGNHGTSANAANFVADRMGQSNKAMTFNGSSDYVNCGNDESLDITDAITIEAWVKSNDTADDSWIISKGGDTGYSLVLGYNDGYVNFYDADYYPNNIATMIPITQGEWTHIVYSKGPNGVLNNWRGYRNGIEQFSLSCDFTLNITSKFLGIGKSPDYNLPFNGSIDEVRIYNRALSPAEILDRYQTGARKLKIDPGSPGVILLNMKASDDYYIRKAA